MIPQISKLSSQVLEDCKRIERASLRNNIESIAILAYLQILPYEGQFIAKCSQDESETFNLCSVTYIDHYMSRAVFRAHKNSNSRLISKFADMLNRHNLSFDLYSIWQSEMSTEDILNDTYDRDEHVAMSASKLLNRCRATLRRWALLRRFVQNRQHAWNSACMASRKIMHQYDHDEAVKEFDSGFRNECGVFR